MNNGILSRDTRGGGGSSYKVKIGTFTASASTTTTVNVGFKPKYLCVVIQKTNAQSYLTEIYNENSLGSGYSLYAANDRGLYRHVLPSTDAYRLNSVTSSGFVFNKTLSTWTSGWYFAIG